MSEYIKRCLKCTSVQKRASSVLLSYILLPHLVPFKMESTFIFIMSEDLAPNSVGTDVRYDNFLTDKEIKFQGG